MALPCLVRGEQTVLGRTRNQSGRATSTGLWRPAAEACVEGGSASAHTNMSQQHHLNKQVGKIACKLLS